MVPPLTLTVRGCRVIAGMAQLGADGELPGSTSGRVLIGDARDGESLGTAAAAAVVSVIHIHVIGAVQGSRDGTGLARSQGRGEGGEGRGARDR